MWKLSLANPVTATPTLGAPIARVVGGRAPIAVIGVELSSEGEITTENVLTPEPVEITLPPTEAGFESITTPALVLENVELSDVSSVYQSTVSSSGYVGRTGSWTQTDSIEFDPSGSFTWNPVLPPPSAGSYAYNPSTKQLVLLLDYDTSSGSPQIPSGYQKSSIQIVGRSEPYSRPVTSGTLTIPAARDTNRLVRGIPRIFYKFPMQGEFTISLNFEQAPSGSFAFECPLSYRRGIECELQTGKSLEIFDIWFRIESLRIQEKALKEYPGGAIVVSVSLGGYYRNEELNLPVPMVGVSPREYEQLAERIRRIEYKIEKLEFKLGNTEDIGEQQNLTKQINTLKKQIIALQNRNTPELLDARLEEFDEAIEEGKIDPECVLGNSEREAEEAEVQKSYVELSRIASKAGVCYRGPSVKIRLPENASRMDCTSFQSHVTEAARINGKFLDYHDKCVRARSWSSARRRSYTEDDIFGDLSNTYNSQNLLADALSIKDYNPEAPDITSPFPIAPTLPGSPRYYSERQDCIPYGAKYCRTKLTGRFTEEDKREGEEETKPKIKNLAPPRWTVIPPVRVTLQGGDESPSASPPVWVTTREGIPDISLCGQFQKTLNEVTTEDGCPIFEQNWIYGFTGTLESGVFWGQVEYSLTVYRYDAETGYLLGFDKQGWRMVQLLSESAGTPTQDTRYLSPSSTYDTKWSNLLNWQICSISGMQRFVVATFSLFYGNIEPPPLVEYKKCLPSGRSVIRYKSDPNYVEPAFAEKQVQAENSILSMPHPDTSKAEPLPPYSSGVRSLVRTNIKIDPAIYELIKRGRVGWVGYQDSPRYQGGDYKFESPTKPDIYTTYTIEEAAQGPEFKDFARNSKFQDSEGRPGGHTRKPKRYAREEPPDPDGEPPDRRDEDPDKDFNYYLKSPGCLPTECEQGSKSYEFAETLSQARKAAQTELEIDDFNSAVSTSCEVKFDPDVRPGDIVKLRFNGVTYHRRVKSVQMSLSLKGWLDGMPFVTWEPMKIDLGIYRRGGISVSLDKEKDYNDALKRLGSGVSPTIPPDDENDGNDKNDRFRLGNLAFYG